MKVSEAKKITGSMTRTSKMPGLSYSLPAWECQVGAKLRKVPGSVCAGCYALKGNYTRYPALKAAGYTVGHIATQGIWDEDKPKFAHGKWDASRLPHEEIAK